MAQPDGSMILAHRDAIDRVHDIGPGEAARLLGEALARGDETMVRAIGERAFQSVGPNDLGGQWAAVLEQFASSSPARQRAAGQLAGQLADRMDATSGIQDRLLRHVRKPVEIQAGNARARAAERRAAAQAGS